MPGRAKFVGVSAVAIGALLSTYAGALRNVGYAQTLGALAVCSSGATEVNDDTALQAAVLNSGDGDVICITTDIEISQTLQIDDTTLTIEGVDSGSGNPTLSGGGARQIINADFTDNSSDDTLTLRNLALYRGNASAPGGAVDVFGQDYEDALVISGVLATDNDAIGVSGRGGVLAARELGRVEISGSQFTDNSAQVTGGAVYLYRAGEVVMDNVDLERNTTTDSSGGALYIGAKAATAPQMFTVTNSDFVDNTSNDQGGGAISVLYFDDTVSLSSVDFIRNTAIDTKATTAEGGAIALRNMTGPVILSSVNAIDNRAEQSGGFLHFDDTAGTSLFAVSRLVSNRNYTPSTGGSLHVEHTQLAINNSSFTDDSAAGDGGAIHADIDTFSVQNSTFLRNQSGDDGGAIYHLATDSSLTVSGSTFAENEGGLGAADNKGGAIYTYCPEDESVLKVSITDSEFSRNRVGGPGGALYVAYSLDHYVAGSHFEGNESLSRSGGSVYFYSNDSFDDTTVLNRVTFADDSAAQYGGSFMAYLNGPLTMTDVTASGGIAGRSGGFAFVRTDDSTVGRHDFTVTDSMFTGFSALGNGSGGLGGVFRVFDANSLTVEGTTMANSSAAVSGGAIYSTGIPAVDIVNSTVTGNSVTSGGGGGLFVEGGTNTLDFVTLTGNSATNGGGLSTDASPSWTVSNSIISSNSASTSAPDALISSGGSLTSTYSIFGSPSSVVGATINDDSNLFGNPKLNGLADNGGPTLTRLPQWDSPVIGAGDPNWSGIPANDQRGAGFPRDAGGAVSIGAVQGSSPKPDPQPPTPVPPSAPLNAAGTARDGEATVTWSPPSSSGSFPVTTYQAVASPGGQSCLSASSPCTITGLSNGTEYTVSVRALNGAGWGAFSSPSAPFTPETPPAPPVEKSIVITGTRGEVRGKPGVIVAGETTGLVGAQVAPWVKFPGQTSYAEGAARPTVDAQGDFTWERRTGKKIYVYFRTAEGDVRSERIIIRPR